MILALLEDWDEAGKNGDVLARNDSGTNFIILPVPCTPEFVAAVLAGHAVVPHKESGALVRHLIDYLSASSPYAKQRARRRFLDYRNRLRSKWEKG